MQCKPVTCSSTLRRFALGVDSCRRNGALAAILLALALVLLRPMAAQAEDPLRPVQSLDGAWQVRMDPESRGEAESWFSPGVAFDQSIQVPGAWEAQGFGTETEKLRHHFLGKGWYKREVEVPAEWSGRRIFLCFDGVHRYATTWVNDMCLGEHIGYLSPFEYDITDLVVPGSPIRVTVRVDSVQRWDVDAMVGAFDLMDYMDTYWGGIHDHVRLEARAATHLRDLFVQPFVTPQTKCRISADMTGDASADAQATVRVAAPDGQTLAERSAPLSDVRTGNRIAMDLEVPGAQLWTTDTPNLYVATLTVSQGDQPVDALQARFGFREIVIDGPAIRLNGQRIFLRGYGDDSVYPETMAPPTDKASYRKRLAVAKSYGFNHVRHHSHFLPAEYYEACDELGLLVSPELPIVYKQFYDKAQGAALDLYTDQWTAAIRRFRNHPSILDWCMSNEMYDSFPIAPDLYRIAKELDPTRPVVDSDGVWASSVREGRDRPTLDLYFTQFNVWNMPLDEPDMYACPTPLKPVIAHEMGNFVTFPRLDEEALFKHNVKPFWFPAGREAVERMGMTGEAPLWAENSEELYWLLHKINGETLRKNPNISGYHWWLLQDYWTTSNGLVDHYFRPKPGIDPEQVRRLNNDVVLLEDGLQLTYRAGQPLETSLLLSNFGPSDLAEAEVSWSIASDMDIASGAAKVDSPVAQGTVQSVGRISAILPDRQRPTRVVLKALVRAGEQHWSNEWFTWVYPAQYPGPRLDAPLYASPELLPWLSAWGAEPIPAGRPLPARAAYVAVQPTMDTVDAVVAGATLLLLKPQGVFPLTRTRFKSAWWAGGGEDTTAATVVYDHPTTKPMAPKGWCDSGWYRLVEGSSGYLLDDWPARPEVLVRGVEVMRTCRNKALLMQFSVGQGSVIVSGLNLNAVTAAGARVPEAEWLAGKLIEHAATLPHPKATLPESMLRTVLAEQPDFTAPFVAGYAQKVRNVGESAPWFTYRADADPTEVCRQTTEGHEVEWTTAPVPATLESESVTFVFAGGLGWISDPQANGFHLFVNGTDVLRFDVSLNAALWRNDSAQVAMRFVPAKSGKEDAAGLFLLRLPKAMLTPGEPCRIVVRSLGKDSRRWFALHPYTDVL